MRTAMDRLLMAADPGVSGAIAYRWGDAVYVYDIPTAKIKTTAGKNRTEYLLSDLAVMLRDITSERTDVLAVVEQVGPRPHDGCLQAFSLGRGFGILQMGLVSLDVETVLVTPRVWKKTMGLTADKEYSRQCALKMYPQLAGRLSRKKDEGRAEALLLLEWLRLKELMNDK